MLTYEVPTDATDEYVHISGSTALESQCKFVATVIEIFETEYLNHPNEADIARLLALNEKRDFPRMFRVHQFYALGVEELSS